MAAPAARHLICEREAVSSPQTRRFSLGSGGETDACSSMMVSGVGRGIQESIGLPFHLSRLPFMAGDPCKAEDEVGLKKKP